MYYDSSDELRHYGTPRHSGRYPWGSGKNPYQRTGDFLARYEYLKKELGLTEKQIAKNLKMSTGDLRLERAIAKNERYRLQVEQIMSLKSDGLSTLEISRQLGIPEGTVRNRLDEEARARMNQAYNTSKDLKELVLQKGLIDITVGSEQQLGISKLKLQEAVRILEKEGYKVYDKRVRQVTNPNPNAYTTVRVLCPPGTEYKDIYHNPINPIEDYIRYDQEGVKRPVWEYPASLDSGRLKIRYSEDGGNEKDGIIEVRRGAKDLSLGNSNYAQVRILVDGTHFLKGVAVYSDNMPDGVDVIFNTNKSKGTPALGPKSNTVLKPIKTEDPNNPFGSLLKEKGGQSYYEGADGKEHLSLINKTREEGEWGEWSKRLPAQFLSKQPMSLIKKQLDLSIIEKQNEYETIMSLTNPTIKKHYLLEYANDCDKTSIHLDAVALPNQKYQVILPVPSLKDNEIYAPNYKEGSKVVLIRYPHAGQFEIPELTVTHRNKEARASIGVNALDAVGINSKVASILSGADFDGDTVMVIPANGPNTSVRIQTQPPLQDLVGFDPKTAYPKYEGMKIMSDTQKQMGVISNLITDMTLKGATSKELAKAVKHSMVVIDAEKHELDYQRSYRENNIKDLIQKYQKQSDEPGAKAGGASTLLSRAKSELRLNEVRVGSPHIDPETGEITYKTRVETYTDKSGNTQYRQTKTTKMAAAKDALTLISDFQTQQEYAYGEYANKLKAMANAARKEYLETENMKRDPQAAKIYETEVQSLKAKLRDAQANAPRERQAQMLANDTVAIVKRENPGMTREQMGKLEQRSLTEARSVVGAARKDIPITDREWEAIQAGAVYNQTLKDILKYTDTDALRARAMPRNDNTALSDNQIARIKALANSGYTNAQIVEATNFSLSTVQKYLQE